MSARNSQPFIDVRLPRSLIGSLGAYLEMLVILVTPQNLISYRNISTRKPLLKGKARYYRPPGTNLFSSASFDIANIFCFLDKTRYLNKEFSCTEPPPLQLAFPVSIS
jgi:hypothetical protein